MRRALVGALCAGAVCLGFGGAATPAASAPPEPDLRFFGGPKNSFEGPCGAAVDSVAFLYVSDYYHHSVEVHNLLASDPFFAAIPNVDPLDGPCGLAVDSAGNVYVNNYHRNVEKFVPSQFPVTVATSYTSAGVFDSSHPTGVAVAPGAGNVYVNARTHVTAYSPSGAPLMDGADPLRIGAGSLGDGYGLAVSAFPGTVGRVYVPDHADDTVKVYDPAVDAGDPVQTIAGPPGGFGSLRDSAVAVDRVTGEIYVADTLAYPQLTEWPEAVIRVFAPSGAYKGRLKYAVIDGSPVGLAVDNSAEPTQGRVFVTSGNADPGSVVAYPPGSATDQSAPPLGGGAPAVPTFQQGAALDPSRATANTGARAAAGGESRATASVVAQKGNLRVTVDGRLAPKRLPRRGTAPISVTVGGEIATTDETAPPQLQGIEIELNRGGHLDATGLPACPYGRIQPGSSQRALQACRDSLVGRGSFSADITLAGQKAYPTGGEMLLFHSVEKGKPVLYGHIYSARPFATSFVIVFAVERTAKGTYGTVLKAAMPREMDAWGRLTSLRMTLERRYSHNGRSRSFLSAGCPAPKGFTAAVFPLARTTFKFQGGVSIRSVLISDCKTRGE